MIEKPFKEFQSTLENFQAFQKRKMYLLEDLRKLIFATLEQPI
jgi:hypothetical protein